MLKSFQQGTECYEETDLIRVSEKLHMRDGFLSEHSLKSSNNIQDFEDQLFLNK